MKRTSDKQKQKMNYSQQTDGNAGPSSIPEPPKTEFRSLRTIFQIRSAGYPWVKAIRIALSMGVPLLIGALMGDLSIGLLASMGGLAAVYVNNEPYLQRALRLLLIVLGFALAIGLGISAGDSVWLAALIIGMVGTVAFFICETWQIPKPSGYLFILVCAVGVGLPIPVSQAFFSSGLAVLGGLGAWVFAMCGVVVKPRGPEMDAVRDAYLEVAGFLFKAGTPEADYARHNAMVALRHAQEVVQAAEFRRMPRTGKTARLRQLVYQANALYLAGIELAAEANGKLVSTLPEKVRALAGAIEHPQRAGSMQVPQPAKNSPARLRVQRELELAVAVAAKETYDTNRKIRLQKQSVGAILKSAFHHRSLVVPIALRMGITITIATFIAAALGEDRPYWVPLTCAAVLNGATPVTIFHRTIQRAVGTGVGILIGAVLLTVQSSPFIIVISVMILQFCIQFAIIRNYGFGVTFITPLALLMVESGRPGLAVSSLISTRMLDTLTGCVIGLLGGLLLWRRVSSTRLPVLLGELIQMEGDVLQRLLTNPEAKQDCRYKQSLEEMRRDVETALLNVRSIYDIAAGEPKNRRQNLEANWPAVVAAQRIGYLVVAGSQYQQKDYLKGDQLQQLKLVIKQLAEAARSQNRPDSKISIPAISNYPTIDKELHALHDALQG